MAMIFIGLHDHGYHEPAIVPRDFLQSLRHCQNAGISGNLALLVMPLGNLAETRQKRTGQRELRQESTGKRDRFVPGHGAAIGPLQLGNGAWKTEPNA